MKLSPACKKTKSKNANDTTFTLVRTGNVVETYQDTGKGLTSVSKKVHKTVSAAKQHMQEA